MSSLWWFCTKPRVLHLANILVILLISSLVVTEATREVCDHRKFRHVAHTDHDDYILYGLTQDCQVFFIRPSQLGLLSSIDVNPRNSYCLPNLIQLHLMSDSTILLVMKQAGSRICTLEISLPLPEMLFGDHVFRYSLLASLSYSSCSHVSNGQLSLDPDLSFLDSAFKDVIYFVDGRSSGPSWSVHQLVISPQGTLRLLDKINVKNYAKQSVERVEKAHDFVLGLDAQRNFLFQRNRFEQNFVYECAFDLLFRPELVDVHHAESPEPARTWLDSLSADGNIILYSETDRNMNPTETRVYAHNVSSGERSCVAVAAFAMEIAIVREETLREMKNQPLPKFDPAKRPVHTKNEKISTVTKSQNLGREWVETERPRKITLKATTVISASSQRIVTSTKWVEEYKDEYTEEENTNDLPTSTYDQSINNPVESSTDQQSTTTSCTSEQENVEAATNPMGLNMTENDGLSGNNTVTRTSHYVPLILIGSLLLR